MSRRVNLKVLPEMRERFYGAKERLSRETGRKLTHDEALEIMIERLEKSPLSAESLNQLEKVRQGLVKVTGREFTLDEAVEFLISFLLEGCSEGESAGSESAGGEKSEKEEDVKSAGEIDVKRARKVWKILEKKKEFVKGFYREPLEPLTYADVIARFIYVPDRVFEKIKARANGNPPLIFLLTAAEQGAEVHGRYLGVVSDPQLNQEVVSYVNKLPKDIREKFISETQKHFQRAVKEVLRRFKKKYR